MKTTPKNMVGQGENFCIIIQIISFDYISLER